MKIPSEKGKYIVMGIFTILYSIVLLTITVFSYGFVDTNFPFIPSKTLFSLVHTKLIASATVYSLLISILFILYIILLRFLRKGRVKEKDVWRLILLSIVILIFSFPGMISNDIFNYIATAKVTFFYHENPYIVMPIEIPNEPMLAFMHAANKIALYGPSWIVLSIVPYILGFGNLYVIIFAFKVFVVLFYIALVKLIWQSSNKNLWALAFFALNPLVLTETIIAGHNDVVMMFFALSSLVLLKRNNITFSTISLITSILIKYATVLLLPIYVFVVFCLTTKREVRWENIWYWSSIAMFIAFLLSPIREEIYAWYFIWPLTFVTMLEDNIFLKIISLGFSYGLMFRIVPFLATDSWIGITPLIKKIATFTPPAVVAIFYAFKKKI